MRAVLHRKHMQTHFQIENEWYRDNVESHHISTFKTSTCFIRCLKSYKLKSIGIPAVTSLVKSLFLKHFYNFLIIFFFRAKIYISTEYCPELVFFFSVKKGNFEVCYNVKLNNKNFPWWISHAGRYFYSD